MPKQATGHAIGAYPKKNKWEARICFKGKPRYLGLYATEKEASEVYQNARAGSFPKLSNRQKSSLYKGVYWSRRSMTWIAQRKVRGITKYIGSYDTEKQAHEAYQADLENKTKIRGGAKKYRGVSWTADRNKWCAKIRVRGMRHFIGMYDTEEEAARAYNATAERLGVASRTYDVDDWSFLDDLIDS